MGAIWSDIRWLSDCTLSLITHGTTTSTPLPPCHPNVFDLLSDVDQADPRQTQQKMWDRSLLPYVPFPVRSVIESLGHDFHSAIAFVIVCAGFQMPSRITSYLLYQDAGLICVRLRRRYSPHREEQDIAATILVNNLETRLDLCASELRAAAPSLQGSDAGESKSRLGVESEGVLFEVECFALGSDLLARAKQEGIAALVDAQILVSATPLLLSLIHI